MQLLLGRPKHPLDRVEHRSVLRDGERQELSLLEKFPDGVVLVDACVIKKEHELLSYELPFILIKFFKGLFEVYEEHQPFSGPVCPHPHLAKVHALISHGTDGGRSGPVRKLVDRIVVLLLGPGVEFEGPGVEGRLVDPNKSAVLLDEKSEELPEDDSILLHVGAVSVFGHLLASNVRHIELLFENRSDGMELDIVPGLVPLKLNVNRFDCLHSSSHS